MLFKMVKFPVTKEIRLLSFAFFFAFAGYDGAQQYITAFFSQIGSPRSGFQALILIYLFSTLAEPLSAIVISKYGAKKSMTIALFFYALFLVALMTKFLVFIYLASALLGFAGAFLWTGQNSYLVRATTDDNRGTNAGFFGTLLFLGAVVGVIVLGLLTSIFSYQSAFLSAAFLTLIGVIFVFRLRDLPPEKSANHFQLLRKVMTSKTAWQLSMIWFSLYFVFGLAIGLIPIEIKNTLGVSYIGGLSSLFYIMPILLSYGSGRLSDIKGRKAILGVAFLICFLGLISLYFSSMTLLLLMGVILISVYYSIVYPITLALVGDVTTKKNLEYLTSFFWMIQNGGMVISLILSTFIQTKMIYIISIGALSLSLLILLPIFKVGFPAVKQRISQEVG
jgi:MFS family permease